MVFLFLKHWCPVRLIVKQISTRFKAKFRKQESLMCANRVVEVVETFKSCEYFTNGFLMSLTCEFLSCFQISGDLILRTIYKDAFSKLLYPQFPWFLVFPPFVEDLVKVVRIAYCSANSVHFKFNLYQCTYLLCEILPHEVSGNVSGNV